MQKLNWKDLTSIQAGVYICVPAIMAGHFLYNKFGLLGSLIGIFYGSILLWGVGLIFAKMSVYHKKVLVDLVALYFGNTGAKIGGLAFAISLMGWFSLQMEMMTTSITASFPQVDGWLINLILSVLIIINVLYGMEGMKKISNISVPFLIGMMAYVVCKIYNPNQALQFSNWDFLGIPMVISFSIAGIVDAPTYFCNSKSIKDSYIATTLVYLLLLPFMALVGVFIATYSSEPNFIAALHAIGGKNWGIAISLFVVLAGWTTNNGNLYSASIAIAPCVGSASFRTRTIALGLIGFLITFLNGLENLENFLGAICIIVGALGAALFARFSFYKFSYLPLMGNEQNFYQILMVAATTFGICAQLQLLKLTGFGFLDSFLITLIGGFSYEFTKNFKNN